MGRPCRQNGEEVDVTGSPQLCRVVGDATDPFANQRPSARQRADLILKKVESHLVEEVALRRL
jgi:hypothetical protein